jgi:hypothetical protein
VLLLHDKSEFISEAAYGQAVGANKVTMKGTHLPRDLCYSPHTYEGVLNDYAAFTISLELLKRSLAVGRSVP